MLATFDVSILMCNVHYSLHLMFSCALFSFFFSFFIYYSYYPYCPGYYYIYFGLHLCVYVQYILVCLTCLLATTSTKKMTIFITKRNKKKNKNVTMPNVWHFFFARTSSTDLYAAVFDLPISCCKLSLCISKKNK